MPKHIIYSLLVAIMPLFAFGNDTANELFKKGNEQYAKAHYKEAAALYQKVVDAGYQSPVVYFNLGNACYKNGDIPSALLYYQKAHKLSPGDDDINFNIRFTNQKTTDKVETAPEFFITRWWHSFILSFSLTTLAVFSIILLFTGSVILIVYRFAGSVSVKKSSFYTAMLLLLLGFATWFIANRQAYYFNAHHGAIIFSGTVDVKSGPQPSSKNLFIIHNGTRVDVLDSNSGWLKIRLVNGSEGWISAADAKEI